MFRVLFLGGPLFDVLPRPFFRSRRLGGPDHAWFGGIA
jgi:hypothetical protein